MLCCSGTKLCSVAVLLVLLHSALGQAPCTFRQCAANQYCIEEPSGATKCLPCDSSCKSCDGPSSFSCKVCNIGFYRQIGLDEQFQPCISCPVNNFGENCTGTCHCLDNTMCNRTNGHCLEWKCERGYQGLPGCQFKCDPGTFGLDCNFICHCPPGDTCDHVNGDCSSRACHPDWDGAGCQTRLPKLALGPTVQSIGCDKILVTWDAFNETLDIGSGPVFLYRIYKRLSNTTARPSPPWIRVGEIVSPPGTLSLAYTVDRDLIQDETYVFRVDAVGFDFDKNRRKVVPGNPSDMVLNLCTTTTKPPTTKPTPQIVFLKIFNDFDTVTDSSTIVVTWTIDPLVQNLDFNLTVFRQFLGNGDCDNTRAEAIVDGPYEMDDVRLLRIVNLEAWSRYLIKLTAVAMTIPGFNETVQDEVLTSPSLPTGSVNDLRVDRVTDTELEVSWPSLACSQRKGPNLEYVLTLLNLNATNGVVNRWILNETSYKWINLQPYSRYEMTVTAINRQGEGPVSKKFYASTLQGAPSPVTIQQLIPTYSTVTVTFDPPQVVNGILKSYSVMVSETSNFDQSIIVTADVSTLSQLRIAVISLRPETRYFFRMAASTERLQGQYGPAKEMTTLKAPPPAEAVSLAVVSQTTNCISVTWKPPEDPLNNITEYVLSFRKASTQESPPISVQLDASARSYQQCDLRPSSLYIVTIAANNVDGLVSSATENLSTDHGIPPTPAVPVFVRSSYTNITVRLRHVISPDVPVTAYQIMVQRVATSGGRVAGIDGEVYAQMTPEEVIDSPEFVVGDGLNYGGYNNSELMPQVYYRIAFVALSTLNNETTFSFSRTEPLLTTPFDPNLLPPLNMSLFSRSTGCLSLSWTVPDTLANTITGFTVVIEETLEVPVLVKTFDLPGTARGHTTCNLQPFTLYTFRVTGQGNGQTLSGGSGTYRTAHLAPPTPVPPVFVNSSYTTITVILEPLALTQASPLTMYEIQVEKVTNARRRRSIDTQLNRSRRMAGVPGEVYAQLNTTDISRSIEFVVGDGKTYGSVVNKALERETRYIIHYVAISTVGTDTKFSYSSMNPPRVTIPYIEPTQAPVVIDEDDNTGVLIGVIVGLILLVLLIIALILLYWWWRRRNRFNPYEIQDEKPKLPTPKDDYDPERYWSKTYNLKDSRHIVAGRELVYVEGARSPYVNSELPDNPAMSKVSFKLEFQSLPHSSNQATNHKAHQNRHLNRFEHLLPYDHSLVQLRPDNNSLSTYINASYIPGYNKTPAYIAAQSPFDDRTVLDFWRLIYQRNIKTVVMITNTVEDNIVKCTQYWPDVEKASFGNFLLQLIECTEYADYTIRTISVIAQGDEHGKIVRLFEFTSWPDHGVPDDPIPFLEMRYKVRRYHNTEPGPILVHCGTGVARTGVFIAVDALIEQYAAEGQVMTFDFVRRMRKDRPFMVRTYKQYVFIYEALFEEFHAGDTLTGFDLKERYHDWTQRNPSTERSFLRDQFQLLENFTRGPRLDQIKTGLLEVNLHKNRFLDVIPADEHRPILKSPGGLNVTDYVNALYVDGYLRKNQFIVTQTPLHTTIVDFWKLVYDEDVNTIVMVENFRNEDTTCAEYWPGVNRKQFEPFFIDLTASYQQDNITIRNFKIYSTDAPRKAAKYVRQFQFNAWAESHLTPQSKTLLLDLIDAVFDWQEESCQNEHPVIVHCQDGALHSGLFAILATICEKMEEDEEVDIYRTIKHIKRRRPQFISDYDQFRFCYKAVWDFMNLRMPGGTFTDTLGQTKQDKLYGVASLSLKSATGADFGEFEQFDTVDLNTTEL